MIVRGRERISRNFEENPTFKNRRINGACLLNHAQRRNRKEW